MCASNFIALFLTIYTQHYYGTKSPSGPCCMLNTWLCGACRDIKTVDSNGWSQLLWYATRVRSVRPSHSKWLIAFVCILLPVSITVKVKGQSLICTVTFSWWQGQGTQVHDRRPVDMCLVVKWKMVTLAQWHKNSPVIKVFVLFENFFYPG